MAGDGRHKQDDRPSKEMSETVIVSRASRPLRRGAPRTTAFRDQRSSNTYSCWASRMTSVFFGPAADDELEAR